MKNKILIGIDAGVKTGFAVSLNGTLRQAKTLSIIEAMEEVRKTALSAKRSTQEYEITVFIEDARKRKWVTGGREKLQGVGSVKRDCKIWEEFCKYHDINYELIAPKDNNTKLSDQTFKRMTGWTQRTSEHARDAVMLIWGRV
ncbi:Uncharacterised protein [Moraxella lacunata]|uniref:Uncharacterized protein n=1 Tax=Moraxella lacunata TaxID=477 RepID=A0A378QGH5_MORLA|nr:hypothetical protein [Moraxella lacunata]STY99848.1 Uncharacterised protein [Moraxella lacunata]